MPLPAHYATGTVSVAANGTVVTGAGTQWIAGGIRSGDLFMARGLSVPILSVDSPTQITLSQPWPGAALSGAVHAIAYTPDASRVLAETRAVLAAIETGTAPEVKWAAPDLAALLADTTAHVAGTVLIARAEGFAYRVVTSGEHLTTAAGIKLRVLPLDGVYNVGAFGAKDGQTATSAIQAAIDAGGVVFVPPGTYSCGPLIHRAKVEIRGVPGKSVIKALATLGATQPLLYNSGAAYADTDLRLDGLVIDGSNLGKNDATQTRLQGLVRYTKATRVRVTNCHLKNVGYSLLTLRSCRDVLITRNEISGAGYNGATANGGSAIWATQTDSDLGRNIRIVGNYIHDNEWHGAHVGGIGVTVSNNVFENNKETHVFSTAERGGANPALMTRDLVVTGNTCRGLKRKDISAHGLELQCWGGLISNNMIADCEHGGIAIERSRDVTVVGNTIRQFGTNPPGTNIYGGIDVYCTGSGAAATANVNISNNVIGMDAEAGLNVAGIRVLNPGGAIPSNVSIHDNLLTGGAFTAGAIIKTAWNISNCRHWNNRGAGDDRPHNGTATVSAAGMLTVDGVPFTPQWIQFTAFANSTAAVQVSHATLVAQVGTVGGVAFATDGANGRASGPAALQAVAIKTPTGADIAVGALDGMTADGFRLNFTTLTAPVVVRYTAHP